MFDDVLVEGLVVAVGNHLARLGFVEGADFPDEFQKGPAAVVEVREPMLDFSRAKWMDVEADIFTVAAIAILLEDAHLIERAAEIGAAKGFVLVKFQTVLIVQMQRP